ncbi:hypothetical protein P872_14885 [Rhodonellum psychrophilum GCM71 = DSM 17998]|uniref:DUF354 domain-containing protein n=2 Tax=Rhodonellum TaxID=336827 RepID=U5C2S3_9BACT|nr:MULTISPECIES: DUF354 domain-containing protein [Rhodonellum]ERM84328.1 hypothetical protein P872_14885 [Rhodonellum psychrophilum GCM71 = DSM 17998]MDO9554492.1 DUF354 domain-containing protein [Rhodonellum sp.]SDZ43089.1 hypothetical protein SAMN05444412_11464 [Rhodonellum ikkaensis]
MNILIDINHPAHVHYFRNFSEIMREIGHQTLFVSRDKEMAQKLLNHYKIPFIDRGKGKDGKIGKFMYMAYANWKLHSVARKFRPDLFLNFLHPYPSQVASYLSKPSLVFSDSEHAKLHHQLTVPFASTIYTPACYLTDLGKKQIRFKSYMELSYLHPAYFTPNPEIFEILGVHEKEKFVIVRFVSWGAAHDFGMTGMSLQNKIHAVQELSKYARVFISSEGKLPENLEKYRIKIPYDRIHDALYYSSMIFGESGTMSSEAAVLGTPAFFISSLKLGYLEEQEKEFGLVFNYGISEIDQKSAIGKAVEILKDQESEAIFQAKRENLLAQCIDTTSFMVKEVLKHE